MNGLWLALVAVYGACAGSYLGVVIDRLPAGRGLAGGSGCDTCGQRLRAADNVPALGYLWLRGGCRTCRVRIPLLWWLLELTTAAAWMGCAVLLGPQVWLALVLLGTWLMLLIVGLGLARGQASPVRPAAPPAPRLAAWAAASLPAAAVAAQVVALGVGLDQHWAAFTALGVVGVAGLVAAVLVAPRARLGRLEPVVGRNGVWIDG